jgi:hypothetical protein
MPGEMIANFYIYREAIGTCSLQQFHAAIKIPPRMLRGEFPSNIVAA